MFKQIILILAIISISFGQGWNTWNKWNSWLGNRLGANLVANGDFHDFTIDYPSIGEASPFYESDFGTSASDFIAYYGTATYNIDGVDGEDDCLKYIDDGTTHWHYIKNGTSASDNVSGHTIWRVTGKVYIPSTNSILDNVRINSNSSSYGYFETSTKDTWVSFDFEIHRDELPGIWFYGQDASGNYSWAGSGSDVFYVKDVKVQRVGLVAWWQFDSYYHAQEGTGKTILQDLSGNGYDLTASTGFDYSNQLTGDDPVYRNGNALEFDGVDDYGYISGTSVAAFSPNDGGFSLAFWIKAETPPTNEDIFNIAQGTPYINVRLLSTGLIDMAVKDDGGTTHTVNTSSSVADNAWHFIVFTLTGITDLKCYVDGTLVNTNSLGYTTGVTFTNTNLWIGYATFGNDYLNAYLSNMAYFNRGISATEVQALYSKPKNWTWNETGSLSRDGWSPVLSGGAELTQDVTGLDANRSYKERIRKDGVTTSTTVTGVTSKTYTLTNGTYEYVKLQMK